MYITDLNEQSPSDVGLRSSGDLDIRTTKLAAYNTFPNIKGVVTSTHTEINNAIGSGGWSLGMITIFSGKTPPNGWYFCDGTNTTPDLRDRFILGSSIDGAKKTGGSGTYDLVKQLKVKEHVLTIDQLPKHRHRLGAWSTDGAGVTAVGLGASGTIRDDLCGYSGMGLPGGNPADGPIYNSAHSHGLDSLKVFRTDPPFYALAFIMYIGTNL